MKLPRGLLMWLANYGVSKDGLIAEVLRLADKLDVPEEWKSRMGLWFQENTDLSSEKILVLVAAVYSELTSPAPGFDPNHSADA